MKQTKKSDKGKQPLFSMLPKELKKEDKMFNVILYKYKARETKNFQDKYMKMPKIDNGNDTYEKEPIFSIGARATYTWEQALMLAGFTYTIAYTIEIINNAFYITKATANLINALNKIKSKEEHYRNLYASSKYDELKVDISNIFQSEFTDKTKELIENSDLDSKTKAEVHYGLFVIQNEFIPLVAKFVENNFNDMMAFFEQYAKALKEAHMIAGNVIVGSIAVDNNALKENSSSELYSLYMIDIDTKDPAIITSILEKLLTYKDEELKSANYRIVYFMKALNISVEELEEKCGITREDIKKNNITQGKVARFAKYLYDNINKFAEETTNGYHIVFGLTRAKDNKENEMNDYIMQEFLKEAIGKSIKEATIIRGNTPINIYAVPKHIAYEYWQYCLENEEIKQQTPTGCILAEHYALTQNPLVIFLDFHKILNKSPQFKKYKTEKAKEIGQYYARRGAAVAAQTKEEYKAWLKETPLHTISSLSDLHAIHDPAIITLLSNETYIERTLITYSNSYIKNILDTVRINKHSNTIYKPLPTTSSSKKESIPKTPAYQMTDYDIPIGFHIPRQKYTYFPLPKNLYTSIHKYLIEVSPILKWDIIFANALKILSLPSKKKLSIKELKKRYPYIYHPSHIIKTIQKYLATKDLPGIKIHYNSNNSITHITITNKEKFANFIKEYYETTINQIYSKKQISFQTLDEAIDFHYEFNKNLFNQHKEQWIKLIKFLTENPNANKEDFWKFAYRELTGKKTPNKRKKVVYNILKSIFEKIVSSIHKTAVELYNINVIPDAFKLRSMEKILSELASRMLRYIFGLVNKIIELLVNRQIFTRYYNLIKDEEAYEALKEDLRYKFLNLEYKLNPLLWRLDTT